VSKRSVGRLFATAGLVAATAVAAPLTHAAPQPAAAAAPAAFGERAENTPLGERLDRELGAAAAGFWLDDRTGEFVVNVLTDAAATAVGQAGARPQRVTRSSESLLAIKRALDKRGGPPGTAWGIDDSTNQVVLIVSEGVPGAAATALTSAVAAHGNAVRVEHAPGMFQTDLQGGEAIFQIGGGRCSAGFNVVPGWPGPYPPSGGNHTLTAGHCAVSFPGWRVGSSTGPYLGPTHGASFPGNDYGIIRKDSTSTVPLPRTINLYNGSSQVISNSGDPYLNRSVCKSGSTTGRTCGRITATNVTANYSQGAVYGLARSNACANAGDSGGGYFEGTTAVGLHSGSNRQCPGYTFLQPVREAMQAFNMFFPAS